MNENEKKSGIYCIENIITCKKYIGQSVNIKNRWYRHKYELNNNTHHNDYLQNAWGKYGEYNFKFYVLEYCKIDDLDKKEIFYIEKYNSINKEFGYNLKTGGQNSNQKYSEETKQKMRDSAKKSYDASRVLLQKENALKQWSNQDIKNKIYGKNNGMYGKHHSEESKKKMSENKKGSISWRRNTTPVLCIEKDIIYNDSTHAGEELKISSSSILKVCKGERNTCGGYHWKFIYK